MSIVNIRYIVDNMDEAIQFYTEQLDFDVVMKSEVDYAVLMRNDLRLLLSLPGDKESGIVTTTEIKQNNRNNWNRIILEVQDLETSVQNLKKEGVSFRNDIISGQEGKLALLEDPSCNPIELFEYYKENPRL